VTDDAAWPAGYALIEFDCLDSTNQEARRRAAAGESGPLWICAQRQTAGRGRRGRDWVSPAGNLAATLLLRPQAPANDLAQLSFVAALATADTICRYAPSERIELKWPNDVLAGGEKIAGILLESASSGHAAVSWLSIGVGINLAYHPDGTEFPATSLAALGVAVPPASAVLRCLAEAWAKWYEIWRGRGFADIRDAWLARAAGLGRRIRARLQNEEKTGVFEGIDLSGALLLRESHDAVRSIAAGDVYF